MSCLGAAALTAPAKVAPVQVAPVQVDPSAVTNGAVVQKVDYYDRRRAWRHSQYGRDRRYHHY